MGRGMGAIVRGVALAAPLALGVAGGATVAAAQDFDAVLAAPDDIDLNLAYAREQARLGNLSAAASTLERILIQDPSRHSVRLYYAVTLYRLGDLQGAQAQLSQLEEAPLSAAQRAEADAYARRVAQGLSPSAVSGALSVGVVYEDDATGAYFTAFDFFGTPATESGTSSEVALSLNGRHALGLSRNYDLYGSLLLYDRTGLSDAAVDYQRANLDVGVSRDGRLTSARLGVMVRHLRFRGDPNLTEVGLNGRLDWRATNAMTVGFRFEAVDQNFEEPLIDSIASFIGGTRDGSRYMAGVSVSNRVNARTTLGFGLDYEVKDADYAPFGYSGPRVSASFDRRFGYGGYVLATGSVRWLDYDEPDAFFLFGAQREDTRSHARIAVGAPLSAFAGGATGDVREAVTLEGAINYGARESTSPLADYDGWGAELRLIWRFGARD